MSARVFQVRCPDCSRTTPAGGASLVVYDPHEESPRAIFPIAVETWTPLVSAYEANAREVSSRYTTFALQARTVGSINRMREALLNSAHALFERCFAGPLANLEGFHVYVTRCQHLLHLSVAACAAARPDASEKALPLDLHPRLPFERVRAIARRDMWPCPTTRQLCVLLGRDLGEGAVVVDSGPECPLTPLDAAAIVRWQMDRDAAFQIVRAAGGRVCALTLDALCSALDGHLGEHLQVVGHVSGDSTPLLQCDDGQLDIRALVGEVARSADAGFSSPVRSVDLSVCSSSGELSEVFHTAKVDYVNSVVAPLHTGALSKSLRTLYESGCLDGTQPIQHAWLRSSLASIP
jgi:hypothetical protein